MAAMADALQIASGIVGLLPLVRECLVQLRDAFVAERKLGLYLGRVELQRTIFQAWDDSWTDSVGMFDAKISDFASTNPLLAAGLLQQLVLLLRTLSHPEKMEQMYGLAAEDVGARRGGDLPLSSKMRHITSYLSHFGDRYSMPSLVTFDNGRLGHMSFLQTIRFGISGNDSQFEDLIWRLSMFNRNIRLFSSRQINEAADRRIVELVVKDVSKYEDRTRRLEEAASYEAKQSIDQQEREKYNNLAKMANFALAIQSASAHMSRKKIFSRDDFSFDTPYFLSTDATLARFLDYPTKYQSRLVLVEWITLPRSTPTAAILETLDETKVTWYILHAEKPERLLLPNTIGLIYDDTHPRSIGIVFQLPPHIRGNLPTKSLLGAPGQPAPKVVRSPKTIAAQRMPVSLRQLILKRETKGLDLGIRFRLAKQLLDAVHLMHTARFCHRNIRPDNILLFPRAAADPHRRDRDPDPSALDYTRPLLVGFHDAPLTIQLSPDPPPPWTQPEGLKPILKNPHRRPPRDVRIDCYQHPERRLALALDRHQQKQQQQQHHRQNRHHQRHRSSNININVNVDVNNLNAAAPSSPSTADSYRRQYDLYGLGCVLLELGLWETLDNVQGRDIASRAPPVGVTSDAGGDGAAFAAAASTTAAAAAAAAAAAGMAVAVAARNEEEEEDEVWKDAETVRKAAKGLDVITGSVYADVTRKCLTLSPVPGDILEFERGLAATLAQIAA